MRRRTERKTVLLPTLAVLFLVSTFGLLLACGSPVQAADRWRDITNDEWSRTYGVTASQVATVAQGRSDGTFGPKESVLRGQFIKMVVSAFGIPRATPGDPTFSDVPSDQCFYPWIEGAAAAGLIPAQPGEVYRPKEATTREEASIALAAFLSQQALSAQGGISGRLGIYASLADFFAAEGPPLLAGFCDDQTLSPDCAPDEAYLVLLGIVRGDGDQGDMRVRPQAVLTRAQAVALILRAKAYLPKAAAPTVSAVAPAFGPEEGGEPVVIAGTGFSQASSVLFGNMTLGPGDFEVRSDGEIDIPAAPPGTGSIDVTVVSTLGQSEISGHDVYTYEATPGQGIAVVQAALKYLDVPYIWGGAGPSGFDCSGLALTVYSELGISLPHRAASQYPLGSPVAYPQLQPGDLLFFGNPISHVGIYVGDGNMIDAPHTGSWVRLESMTWSDYAGACRVLEPQLPDGANDGDGEIAQQTDCQLSYSGRWNSTSTTSASGGSFAYSGSPGASVTIAFTGTHVSWIGKMSPLYGLATVSLDGAEPVTVDLYSPTILWQQVVWESGELEDGPHTVTITCTGQKSPDATEANISLDALTVAGSLE